jgi:hypothetical protein
MNTFNKEKDLQANYNGEKKGSENNTNAKVDTTSPMAINLGQKKMTVLDLTKIYEKGK